MFRLHQRIILKGRLSITNWLSHQELLQNLIFHHWKFYLDVVKKDYRGLRAWCKLSFYQYMVVFLFNTVIYVFLL